jgi:branched-chain amino acid transport system substrate-binding protein
MSRFNLSRIGALLIIFALVLAACQPAATPTPTQRPPATATPAPAAEETEEAAEEAVAEATEEAAAEATEEASVEATEEAVSSAEATEEAAEEVVAEATEEAVEEVVAEATEEASEEVATEEAVSSAEATEEASEEVVAEATEEAVEEVVAEETEEAAEEVVAEATEEAVEEVVAEATEEAVEEVVAEETEEASEEAVAEATEEASLEPTAVPETTDATEIASDLANAVTISADDEVVIGFSAAISGSVAVHGINIQRGAELALADRPTVTVGGQTFNVRLDIQDDLCSAEGGQAVANRFISDPSIVGVVGPMCSSGCRAAAPIFDSAGLAHISPSCTAADLTTSGYTTFNRTIVSDAFQGVVMADYIFNELGITRIATIHDGSPYGEGLVAVLTDRFLELGGEVVASDAISTDDTDFRGLLEDIAQEDPELIYFGGFNEEGALLAQQRGDAGLEDVVFMGADGIRSTEYVELAGDAAEGSYASNSVPAASESLDAFLARYVEAYGEEPPSSFHTNTFDATNLLLDAIEAVGTLDEDGNLVIDRTALNAYLHSVQNFEGLTGTLNADGTGEMAVSDIGIFQVIDGAFVQIATGSLGADGVSTFTAVEAAPEEAEAAEEAEAEEAESAEEADAEEAEASEEAEAEATAEATAAP